MPQTFSKFTDLFRKATDRAGGPIQVPFPYQQRFAEEGAECPDLVHAPTGAGKTATAVLGWLWRRRFHPDPDVRRTTPRRLVYCLPMRVLVEQTFGEAIRWLHRLGLLDAQSSFSPDAPGTAGPYRPRLTDETADKIAVHLLMGGEQAWDWDLYPERDAVLIGTQDMLLSRALNRGYGMSRFRWPMHYGLLNCDCLWVFDEVQLMSTGLSTATQLQAFRTAGTDGDTTAIGPAKSVWMSATLLPDWLASVDFRDRLTGLRTLSLGADDYAADGLKERREGEKPLKPAGITADEKNAKPAAGFVADKHIAGTLTLVIVNTVDRSRRLYEALRKQYGLDGKPKGRGKKSPASAEPAAPIPDIKLIHSRFRPVERAKWSEWLRDDPSKLPPGGRIVVATQVVEAGVDLSARTLVTELGPWPSLVQRFGRCNRRGEFGKEAPAAVFWIDLRTEADAGEKEQSKSARPYLDAELNAAREHLRSLNDAGLRTLQEFFDGLSADQRATLFPYEPSHVVRRKDFVELFDTTPDLVGNDIDVSRFIREGEDLDIQVFWRANEPRPEWTKAELRRQAPRREELCPVPLLSFREDFLRTGKKSAYRFDSLDGRWERMRPDAVRPGQVYWIPAEQGGYNPEVGWSPDVPALHASWLIPPRDPEGSGKAETDYDADEWAEGVWQTIAEHTDAVTTELSEIVRGLPLSDDHRDALRVAARWHDWGKRHVVFQNAIVRRPADLENAEDLAKAPDGCWERYGRPHFRHELASASAVLTLLTGATTVPPDWARLVTNELADLAAYLIAAHHGKVRLSIRSLPGEMRPDYSGTLFARGVWDGDPLPEVCLGGKPGELVVAPSVSLDLSPMQLGVGPNGQPSWAERMLTVRDKFGPMTVAYLEAVLRAADMRGSRAAEARTQETAHA